MPLIDQLAPTQSLELYCVDTWQGGLEHQAGASAPANMSEVEQRFDRNLALALDRKPPGSTLHKMKSFSDLALALLLAEGKRNYFDLVYIDGSHQAPDVLCDAVLGFRLLRVGGMMIFDDYLWSEPLAEGPDLIRCPKPAIDAFTNLYARKLRIFSAPLYQLYLEKTAD